MFVLIMAGGSGSRLWPASRRNSPKQLLNFFDRQTLLQRTFSRMRKGFKTQEIFVATTRQYSAQILKQIPGLPKSHLSVEPEMRDRGPALGLAALIMERVNPKASFATSWSDDYIKNGEGYLATLRQAENYLKSRPQSIIAVGVVPSYANTGFRYIQQGQPIRHPAIPHLYSVKRFTEKPADKEAKKYFLGSGYLWNTGYFITSVKHFLKLYETYLPEIYRLLMQIKPAIGTKKQQQVIDEIYPKMPKVDFEQVLINHPKELLVVPASFDWADVGRWKTVKDILSSEKENLIKGKVRTVNTDGSLIYNYEDKLVGAVGLKNIVVVNTKDALLVMNKDDSEQVKNLVEKIKKEKDLAKYL